MKLLRTLSLTPEDKPLKRRLPQDAEGWALEAESALELDDHARAVVCYRRALELAPFCTMTRDAFEAACEDQAGGRTRGPGSGASNGAHFGRGQRGLRPSSSEGISRRAVKPGRSKRGNAPEGFSRPMVAGACAALFVTMAALVTAASTTNMLSGFFGSSSPSSESVSSAVAGEISAAEVFLVKGNATAAADRLRKALKANPKNAEAIAPTLKVALYAIASNAEKGNNFTEAAAAYREACVIDATDSTPQVKLSEALRRQAATITTTRRAAEKRSLLADAENAVESALKIDPSSGRAMLEMARVCEARKDTPRAVKAYEQIAAASPSSVEATLAKQSLAALKKR
ncbi:hypothetical protein BH09SUM1_BH09SUM1_08060 [soil metagenome]